MLLMMMRSGLLEDGEGIVDVVVVVAVAVLVVDDDEEWAIRGWGGCSWTCH